MEISTILFHKLSIFSPFLRLPVKSKISFFNTWLLHPKEHFRALRVWVYYCASITNCKCVQHWEYFKIQSRKDPDWWKGKTGKIGREGELISQEERWVKGGPICVEKGREGKKKRRQRDCESSVYWINSRPFPHHKYHPRLMCWALRWAQVALP